MGLDNGLYVTHYEKGSEKPYGLSFQEFESDPNKVEIAYWRKFWTLRDRIINKLHLSGEGGEYSIDPEDLTWIIRILSEFMDSKYYDESESIWTYSEMKDTLFRQIVDLLFIKFYWVTHPELKVFFYDSY